LKVLAFTLGSTSGGSGGGAVTESCRAACESLVRNAGLKHLFAALMKKYSKRLRKDYPSAFSDAEENGKLNDFL
jgi:hypothetical protein